MIYELKHKLIFHFMCSFLFYALQRFDIFQVISSMVGYPYQDGGSSLTNEKDHHYFLNRFVCVGEFFDG